MNTDGRRYRVVAELTYLGGTIPPDSWDALAEQIRRAGLLQDLSLAIRRGERDTALVAATIRRANAVAALAEVAECVERALIATGLFDEFDATGTVLRIAPAEAAERVYWTRDEVWRARE